MELRLVDCDEWNQTGSGSCTSADFGICGIEQCSFETVTYHIPGHKWFHFHRELKLFHAIYVLMKLHKPDIMVMKFSMFQKNKYKFRWDEVLVVTSMKMAVFWDVALCSLVDINQHQTISARLQSATSQKTAIIKPEFRLIFNLIVLIIHTHTQSQISYIYFKTKRNNYF
jgi:hypothetical protein